MAPRHWSLMALATLVAWPAAAQDALSEGVLKNLKAATAFVRTDRGGGTAFLVRRDDTKGYFITCAHVLEGVRRETLRAVVNAGSPQEVSLPMKILGIDAFRDLAVLQAERTSWPTPIGLAADFKIRETLPVYIAGFPFGDWLATGSGAPAPTISRGTVSSLREDEHGALRIVQIDGDLNIGNAGGPVVDKTGALIGVAVAKVRDTRIGYAASAGEVADILQGRAFPPSLISIGGDSETAKVQVQVGVVDPLRRIGAVQLLLVPKIRLPGPPKPGPKGVWGPVWEAVETFPIPIKDGEAIKEITVKKADSDEGRFLAQLKYSREGTGTLYTPPVEVQLDFRAAPAPSKAPEPSPSPSAAPAPVVDFSVRLDEKLVDATVQTEGVTPAGLKWQRLTWPSLQSSHVRTVFSGRFGFQLHMESKAGSGGGGYTSSTTIRKINLDTLGIERQVTLEASFGRLAISKSGLVLVGSQSGGTSTTSILLDAETLQVAKKLPALVGEYVLSNSNTSFAILADRGPWLSIYDLVKGQVVARQSLESLAQAKDKPKVAKSGRLARELRTPTLSEDGKWLVGESEGTLHRLRVEAAGFRYEEAGARIADREAQFVLSPDSKHLLITTPKIVIERTKDKDGRVREEIKQRKDERQIFRMTDLDSAFKSVKGLYEATLLGFEPGGASFYAVFPDKRMVRMDLEGTVEADHPDVIIERENLRIDSKTRLLLLGGHLARHYVLPK